MPDEDLYIGPTVLAPGAPEGPGVGHRIATKVLVPLLVIFVAVVLVFYVFYQRGRVVGPSMLPTLHSGDMVLLTKDYPQPRRGDIVFTQVTEEGRPVEIVKRVIGLPGDTVEIRAGCRNRQRNPGTCPRPGRAARSSPCRSRSIEFRRGLSLPDGRQPDGVGGQPLHGPGGRSPASRAESSRSMPPSTASEPSTERFDGTHCADYRVTPCRANVAWLLP